MPRRIQLWLVLARRCCLTRQEAWDSRRYVNRRDGRCRSPLVCPRVNRLVTDPEIGSSRRNRRASSDQIEDFSTKLGWIAMRKVRPTSRVSGTADSSIPTSLSRGKTGVFKSRNPRAIRWTPQRGLSFAGWNPRYRGVVVAGNSIVRRAMVLLMAVEVI